MTQFRLVGTATDAQSIADCLNLRRLELGLTLSDLDAITGFTERYCSKIFAPGYAKNLGKLSLPVMLDTLGCRLAIIANDAPDALPPVTRRAIREKSCSGFRIQHPGYHKRPSADL